MRYSIDEYKYRSAKIIKCKDSSYWYKDLVGTCIKVIGNDGFELYQLAKEYEYLYRDKFKGFLYVDQEDVVIYNRKDKLNRLLYG
jgi:hypothetical protein